MCSELERRVSDSGDWCLGTFSEVVCGFRSRWWVVYGVLRGWAGNIFGVVCRFSWTAYDFGTFGSGFMNCRNVYPRDLTDSLGKGTQIGGRKSKPKLYR